MSQTKDLKNILIKEDPAIKEIAETYLNPMTKRIKAISTELDNIVRDALKKKRFPKKDMEAYRAYTEKGWNEIKILRFMALSLEKLKDQTEWNKYQSLLREMRQLQEKGRELMWGLEKKYHYIESDKTFPYRKIDRPVEPVEYISFLQSKDFWPPAKRLIRTYASKEVKKPDSKYFIEGDFVYFQIDLSYDKSEILKSCDDAITKAQEFSGKKRRSKTEEHQQLFETYFLKYYKPGVSVETALSLTSKILSKHGINKKDDTYRLKYLPMVKAKYGVKDFRDLHKRSKP
jgi:hypothetical protein